LVLGEIGRASCATIRLDSLETNNQRGSGKKKRATGRQVQEEAQQRRGNT